MWGTTTLAVKLAETARIVFTVTDEVDLTDGTAFVLTGDLLRFYLALTVRGAQ